jgi:hypothetical protein
MNNIFNYFHVNDFLPGYRQNQRLPIQVKSNICRKILQTQKHSLFSKKEDVFSHMKKKNGVKHSTKNNPHFIYHLRWKYLRTTAGLEKNRWQLSCWEHDTGYCRFQGMTFSGGGWHS